MLIYSDKILINRSFKDAFLKIEDGVIVGILDKNDGDMEFRDFAGHFVLPGFINVDSHFIHVHDSEEKPDFNKFALKNIEHTAAMSGITTLYHSVYLSGGEDESFEKVKKRIKQIKEYNCSSLSMIESKVHLKFDITTIGAMDHIKELMDIGDVDLLSFEVFSGSLDKNKLKDEYLRYYFQSVYGFSDERAEKILEKIRCLRDESRMEELSYLVKLAHHNDIKFLCSSQKLLDNIAKEYKDSFDIVETNNNETLGDNDRKFSTCIQAEDILSDGEIINEKKIDFITSGSRCANLLFTVFKIAQKIGLETAAQYVSKNSAKALGLNKRGEISEGFPANLCVIKVIDDFPVNVSTFYRGREKIRINL